VASVLRLLTLLSFAGLAHAADPNNPPSAMGNGARPLGSTWADAAKMPDLFSGMWLTFAGFVEGDAKLNVPYTAQAHKYVAAYQPKRDIPYAEEGCRSPGLPIAMRMGGGIKFTYAPGLISIYMQSLGHTRFVRMNQTQGKTSPKFYGNSVGHWEGATLVVESENFRPEITFQYGVGKPLPALETVGTANLGPPPGSAHSGSAPPGGGALGGPPPSLTSLSAAIWGPHGADMRMVERMRLVDPQTLQVNLEVYDDTVWTQPYVTTRNYRRVQPGSSAVGQVTGEPEEWVCTLSITTFDPNTNTYVDKDPEEMVKMLDSRGK